MSISVDGAQARGSLLKIRDSIEAQALRQAVSRAASKGRTFASREIRAHYAMKASDVSPAFSVKAGLSVGGVPAATITAAGKRGRNVILFLRAGAGGRRGRKRAELKFEIRKGRRVQIPGSFVAEYNRGRFVARRKPGTVARNRSKYAGTKHAEALESIYTIDVPGMFSARRVMDATVRQIRDEFLPQETLRGLRDAIRRAMNR
jgi:hypothetical protein